MEQTVAKSNLSIPHFAVTQARKDKYLAALRQSGSHSAATRAASAHLPDKEKGRKGRVGYQTFLDLRKSDPAFAVACEEAMADCLAAVENAITDRALNPPKRPVIGKDGQIVGYYEDRNSSDRLLVTLAKKLNREDWGDKATIDHNVNVKGAILSIQPSDVLLLDPKDQERFLAMCETIADRKGEANSSTQTIDHIATPMMPLPMPTASPAYVTSND
jgi:hypothetical protein